METTTPPRVQLADLMSVDVPEGTHGTVTVERFDVVRDSLRNWQLGARSSLPGTYTRLMRNGSLWMSDTTAERRDHLFAAMEIQKAAASGEARVLIGGLGLGMILRVALLTPGVAHVDVVEIDTDVIALVGPHYQAMAAEHGVTLVLHEADVYAITWPPNTRWDVAYFDVWRDLTTDNLPDIARLRRSYGRRAGWCDCWARSLLLYERQRERRYGW